MEGPPYKGVQTVRFLLLFFLLQTDRGRKKTMSLTFLIIQYAEKKIQVIRDNNFQYKCSRIVNMIATKQKCGLPNIKTDTCYELQKHQQHKES